MSMATQHAVRPASTPSASRSQATSSQQPEVELNKENVIALLQDCAALLSITVEASTSMLHDTYRKTLSFVGWGEEYSERRKSRKPRDGGEAFRTQAIVIIGANCHTGQSLAINFARSGYTVFPLLPLPSPYSPPTSPAFTTLTLMWSRIQKRIKKKHPRHQGSIIPVMFDPIHPGDCSTYGDPPDLRGLYCHSTDTIRAYCQENRLTIVAIICAAQPARKYPTVDSIVPELSTPAATPPRKVKFSDDTNKGTQTEPQTPPKPESSISAEQSSSSQTASPELPITLFNFRPLSSESLAMTHEYSLINLYHNNVIEPLAIIRELGDLVAKSGARGKGRGRIIFVNGPSGSGVTETEEQETAGMEKVGVMDAAMKVIGTSRMEAARLLREELVSVNIDVSEVVVGPMILKDRAVGYHARHSSDESNESDHNRKRMIDDVFGNMQKSDAPNRDAGDKKPGLEAENSVDDRIVYAKRFALLSKIWAVDDALLYSAVERALEERYPRYRHYAGISPLLESISKVVPGSSIVKMIGRWVVGKLIMMPKK